MADSTAIARIRANALRTLKETGPHIAVQLGIEPPQLAFFYKDKDYQQAQELAALATWLTAVNEALSQAPAPAQATEDPSPTAEASLPTTKGGDNGHTKTKNPQSGG